MSGRRLVFVGLSITSSWGNGHATTYRALLQALARRGSDILFLEHDVPWYRENRDLPNPSYVRVGLYDGPHDLRARFAHEVRDADAVVVGSYVVRGGEVCDWVTTTARGTTGFYDIDTPVTLAALDRSACAYLTPDLVPRFDLYLSFTAGPTLARLERDYGARMARPLYCSFDPAAYYPEPVEPRWDLGYMGTFSEDRQPALERLLGGAARLSPDRRFVVAGPGYPLDGWPANVDRIEHLPPHAHRSFYNAQRFTLNLTRSDMVRAGYSPSVRLFEAAACGVPIISDWWDGLDTLFHPQSEILISRSAAETRQLLASIGEDERKAIGDRARRRVLEAHTAEHRARQFEAYIDEARRSSLARPTASPRSPAPAPRAAASSPS
jgi:spore maturation protein CgeB